MRRPSTSPPLPLSPLPGGQSAVVALLGLVAVAVLIVAVAVSTGWLGTGSIGWGKESGDSTRSAPPAGEGQAGPSALQRVAVDDVPWARGAAEAAPAVGVQVVVTRNGSALAEPVTVAFVDLASARGRPPGDLDALFTDLGRRFRTDPDGMVVVPATTTGAMVAAWSAGDFALESIRAGTETVHLDLQRDRAVQVQVLDATGAPAAGVPVALRADLSPPLQVLTAVTGLDGQVRLRHLDRYLVRTAPGHSVAVDVPSLRPPATSVDPASPPADPVVLSLPATGSFEVTVLDPAGRPLTRPGTVEVLVVAAAPGQTEDASHQRSYRYPLEGGRVTVDHVGLGLQCILLAQIQGIAGKISKFSGFGPRTPGERVSVVLRAVAPDVRYLGRVLDGQGKPVATEEFAYAITSPRAHSATIAKGQITTDAEGRFAITLTGGRRGFADRLTLTRKEQSGHAEKELDQRSDGREIALGDLRLR